MQLGQAESANYSYSELSYVSEKLYRSSVKYSVTTDSVWYCWYWQVLPDQLLEIAAKSQASCGSTHWCGSIQC